MLDVGFFYFSEDFDAQHPSEEVTHLWIEQACGMMLAEDLAEGQYSKDCSEWDYTWLVTSQQH